MTTSPARVTRGLVALALPAVALLAGCSSAEAPAGAPATLTVSAPTAVDPPTSASAPTTTASAPATVTGAADAPACPDAATLAAVSPSQAPGVQLTEPTCSGPWAVIGISGPVPGPVVELFRYADGAWAPADRDAACADGELPADIEPGVCQAG